MCCPEKARSPVPLLLLVAAVAAVLFWPTVAMVARTVAMIVKAALIAGLAAIVAGGAIAIGVRLRRVHRHSTSASVVAVQPARRVDEQIAALTAAVNRLADERRPALPAPVSAVLLEQQVQALLLQLSRLAADRTGELRPRELAERWDAR